MILAPGNLPVSGQTGHYFRVGRHSGAVYGIILRADSEKKPEKVRRTIGHNHGVGPPNNAKPLELVRGLGLGAATAVVIGLMIGQAVFLVASDMSREVGSVWKVLAAWIVGGVIVLFGALCYSELGAAIPEAGGDYIYLGRGIGLLWGFLFGWTTSVIMAPGASAVVAAGLLRFVAFLAPFRLESSHSIPVTAVHVYIHYCPAFGSWSGRVC